LAGAPVFVINFGAVVCAECAHGKRSHVWGFSKLEKKRIVE
jgi:hypothetical protein